MPRSELDDPPGLPPDPDGAPGPADDYRAQAARVYAVALRMLGDPAAAEDVTHEVLPRVVRRPAPADRVWLYRVTVNAVLALRRTRAGAGRSRSAPAAADGPGDRLEAAIGTLPEAVRDPFVLADVEGLPEAEVAGLLGVGVAAVKDRLHRARLLLRAALGPS